ncbi:hypothetical protein ACN38_g12789, partial [Penicillium nordicum]
GVRPVNRVRYVGLGGGTKVYWSVWAKTNSCQNPGVPGGPKI